jgi:hypothetical protein
VSARDYRPWTDKRLVIDAAAQDVAASVAQIRAALAKI